MISFHLIKDGEECIGLEYGTCFECCHTHTYKKIFAFFTNIIMRHLVRCPAQFIRDCLCLLQERERRRQHMIFMRQLEGKKRNDERDRKREELRLERERDRERKMEQKRLENEIINEMRKPIEDMCLTDQRPLPDLNRIPHMMLSGEAFANILMVYEFLLNFGHRLGFGK